MSESRPKTNPATPRPGDKEEFGIENAPVDAIFSEEEWQASIEAESMEAAASSESPRRKLPWLARGARKGRAASGEDGASISYIPTAQVQPAPATARKRLDLEELQSLGRSIRDRGMLQPILVRRSANDNFELIAGYRRWLAASLAEVEQVPALVMEQVGECEALEIALVENLQRKDLTVIEEAEANRTLIEKFGRTHQDVATLIGKSRSYVTNGIRLLALPDEVKEMLESGKLSVGHARALLTAEKPTELAHSLVTQQLTVRDTEKLVTEGKQASGRRPAPPSSPPIGILQPVPGPEEMPAGGQGPQLPALVESASSLEQELSTLIGLPVEIRTTGSRPTMVISADSEVQILWAAQRLKAALQNHSLATVMDDATGRGSLI